MQTISHTTIGLDIGIASVGWAVLNKSQIINLGVRTFDKAEDKEGNAYGTQWRELKVARRRLHRKTARLKKLRRALHAAGMVPSQDAAHFETTELKRKEQSAMSPWGLRSAGLDRLLTPSEWARALYHVVKHRGFLSTRKAERVAVDTVDKEISAAKKEKQGLLAGIATTEAYLRPDADGVIKYRTLGEMAVKHPAFHDNKRNKAGRYVNSMSRLLLKDELICLFKSQRERGNTAADETLEAVVIDLLMWQKEALSGQALLAMLGHCTFEMQCKRAAKFSYSAERFVWLSKLNNLKISQGGKLRPLSQNELQAAQTLPYTLATVNYKQLRDCLVKACGFPGDWREASFNSLSYRVNNKFGKDPEVIDVSKPEDIEKKTKLIELKGWQQMRKALAHPDHSGAWQRISTDAALYDRIATALSIYKSDTELKPALAALGLQADVVETLLGVDFSRFINLSLEAINKLMSHLEQGLRYDEACTAAGYKHSEVRDTTRKTKYLAKLDYADVRNPVVYRALNQSRKVLNAIIAQYGSPTYVHVEMARDLSKSFKDRKDIEKGQNAFKDEKATAVAFFKGEFGREPRGNELAKLRLYREQNGQCAYTTQALDLGRLFDTGYAEIDHILPYARSFDDSMNNKVLVLKVENQQKGNRTPFEYKGSNAETNDWRTFVAWVHNQKSIRKAKRDRLLRTSFTKEEAEGFKERNLNDTRWVTKLFATRLRDTLQFAELPNQKGNEIRVLTPSGGFTSFLRTRWGLLKDRSASDLHHALDACVIAAASHSLIKRVSDYNRGQYVQLKDGKFMDSSTGEILDDFEQAAMSKHFPQPWTHFREELELRLKPSPAELLAGIYSPDFIAQLKPVFVSRAVKRLSGGAVHQDTIRSVKDHLGPQTSAVKCELKDLNISKLARIVGSHDPRNAPMIAALKARLEAFGDKGDAKFKADKAFAAAFYKPSKNGAPTALVRSVKLKDVQKGGVPVRGGVADQASMWRVDVFCKAGKYYMVPIYQSDRREGGVLPNRAATANTPRSEWTLIDESFEFRFSLQSNDLILLKTKKEQYHGYFAGLNVANGSISIHSHARFEALGKDGTWTSLGVKTGVESFEKFNVDVLGNYYPTKQE